MHPSYFTLALILGADMAGYDDVVWAVQQAHLGGLSAGQKIAAALMLNRHDWLESQGYTMAEAIFRLDTDWLRAIAEKPQRILSDAGVHN